MILMSFCPPVAPAVPSMTSAPNPAPDSPFKRRGSRTAAPAVVALADKISLPKPFPSVAPPPAQSRPHGAGLSSPAHDIWYVIVSRTTTA